MRERKLVFFPGFLGKAQKLWVEAQQKIRQRAACGESLKSWQLKAYLYRQDFGLRFFLKGYFLLGLGKFLSLGRSLPLSGKPLPPQPSNAGAVIVTYHPSGDLEKRIQNIAQQFSWISIVDNSGGGIQTKLLKIKENNPQKIEIIFNEKNEGLARALNQGVKNLARRGKESIEWVALFDQDTEVVPGYLHEMSLSYREYPHPEKLGLMGANFFVPNTGKLFIRKISQEKRYSEIVAVITSGSLLPLKVWRDVGPKRDKFFIDSVDDEYCLRLGKYGYKVIVPNVPLLLHAIG